MGMLDIPLTLPLEIRDMGGQSRLKKCVLDEMLDK